MKPSYQITEVARLYGLNPDTLRYYEEQGLLHPVRGENRYRMYGIDDICNINVIRALSWEFRSTGFAAIPRTAAVKQPCACSMSRKK